MSRFANVSSALSLALSQIKDDIKTVQAPIKPKPKVYVKPHPKQQTINGHVVQWEDMNGTKVPFIQTESFYVSYPSKNEDIKDVPQGTARASYNAEESRVEYFKLGKEEPDSWRYNQKFTGLPYPKFMSGLETVEEVYLVDLETGELNVELKINVLDEYSHWLLRLKEFEVESQRKGVTRDKIEKRMAGFIKNLKMTRGVDILDPKNKIPDHLLSAIEFVKMKQAIR